ncbi:MAG: thiolase [Betaproteobacteria bacterium]|nr:thiolase [Betaproteobacteria bacterium]MDH4323613.1 thiolase [Betaproteobacteria bacterium]
MRGSVAIAGVGLAGCGEAPGWTEMEIAAAAAKNALDDAGLTARDVDGIVIASTNIFMSGLALAEHLGVRPKFTESSMVGGSSFVGHLIPAMLALNAGLCDTILVAYGSNQRTGTGRAEAGRHKMALDPQVFEHPYKPFNPPTSYALAAARHMHQYGTTRAQLAEIAVAARQWAQLNPEAFARDPLTLEDVLDSRMISDPLTVRDCCLVTDGGGAYVLTRAGRGKALKKAPAYLLGVGAAHWHRQISSMPDLTVTAATESGQRAFGMAGLGPRDIDVVELYDAFTINTLLFLEDLGFCKKGEGGAFVSGGRIAPGGELPVNTNGGGLSCVHPGMYGIFLLIEAVRQLRREAGDRQVRDAAVALAHGNGGVLSSQITAILGTQDTL